MCVEIWTLTNFTADTVMTPLNPMIDGGSQSNEGYLVAFVVAVVLIGLLTDHINVPLLGSHLLIFFEA